MSILSINIPTIPPKEGTVTRTRNQIGAAALCSCICAFTLSASAMDYVFPANAKVIDVTQAPYSADKTGKTDVSAILTKAVNDDINRGGWCPGVIYLPNGTYLLKNTLAWRLNGSSNGNGPHVIGQSRTGTVIKLAKGTWPLGTELKGAIQTGAGVEQNFFKGIRNLTVLVDSNNAGAIGIIYVSNNTGLLSDVDVISADGKGAYGIQSSGGTSGVGGNGPFIIRRTFIKGFQYGIRVGCTQGAVASQIRLQGQTKYGIWTTGGGLSVDSLTSNDTCPAVNAESPIMLVHAVLTGGGSSQYAIRNFQYGSYFGDVITSGYRAAISSVGTNRPPTTASFAEYTPVPPSSLNPSPKRTLNLPTRYPPEVAWETDFTKWAFVADYKTAGRTDEQAFQAAIDDATKTTVCLAGKTSYRLQSPVYVRGTISRILGTGGTLDVSPSGQLVIDDGSAPVVMLERLGNTAYNDAANGFIIKKTSRTAVIESVNDGFRINVTGGGETYMTDLTGCPLVIDNPSARVYLWQWEGHNYEDSSIVVRNGMVRSVGYYMEGEGNSFICHNGFTEILGSWYYSMCGSKSNIYLLWINNTANVSAAGLFQQNFCGSSGPYYKLISETRGTTTKLFCSSAGACPAGSVVNPAGDNVALFTAYDSAQVQSFLATGIADRTPVAARNDARFSLARTPAGIEAWFGVLRPGPVMILAYDMSGRIISVVNDYVNRSGMHRLLLPRGACPPGMIGAELRAEGKNVRRLLVPGADK